MIGTAFKALVEIDRIQLSIILVEERPGYWLAQVLEKDMNTQGPSAETAYTSIKRMIRLRYDKDLSLKRKPFADLSKAPRDYWHEYEKATPLSSIGESSRN